MILSSAVEMGKLGILGLVTLLLVAGANQQGGAQEYGQITGEIKLLGLSPALEPLTVKKQQDVCGQTKPDEMLLVSPAGGIRNVVVSIEGVKNGKKPLPKVTGLLDNNGCQFIPHVQVLPLGATVEIKNSDSVLHNTRGLYAVVKEGLDNPYRRIERKGTAFNLGLPLKGHVIKRVVRRPGLMAILCDEHSWMSAYIVIFDYPYFSLTDGEGKFNIGDLPPGKYQIKAWHEALGTLTKELTIKPGEKLNLTLEFSLPKG